MIFFLGLSCLQVEPVVAHAAQVLANRARSPQPPRSGLQISQVLEHAMSLFGLRRELMAVFAHGYFFASWCQHKAVRVWPSAHSEFKRGVCSLSAPQGRCRLGTNVVQPVPLRLLVSVWCSAFHPQVGAEISVVCLSVAALEVNSNVAVLPGP